MVDYKTNDPKGWCGDPERGAAMGRPSIHLDEPRNYGGRLHLRRVRMSACGAYDSNGTYFGSGTPIYWVASADGEIDYVLRADSREQAKLQVRETYPNARFHR